jgi:hypothetical protein
MISSPYRIRAGGLLHKCTRAKKAGIVGGFAYWRERSARGKKRSETAQSLQISKGRTLIYRERNTQHLTPFPN